MGRRGSRGPSESRTDPCLLLAHRHRTYARGAFPPAAIMARRHESGPRRAFPQLLSLSFPPVPRCVGMASALQRKLLLILQLASLMSPGQAWFRRIQSVVKAQSPKCTSSYKSMLQVTCTTKTLENERQKDAATTVHASNEGGKESLKRALFPRFQQKELNQRT